MEPSSNPFESPVASSGPAGAQRPFRVRVQADRRLPRVCAICGEPAVLERRAPIGGLKELSHWSSDEPSVFLPLCSRHRRFRWNWPTTGRILLSLPGLILTIAGLVAPSVYPRLGPSILVVMALIALDLGILLWLVLASRRIRSQTVSPTQVMLIGVSWAFVEACQDEERRESQRAQESLDNLV